MFQKQQTTNDLQKTRETHNAILENGNHNRGRRKAASVVTGAHPDTSERKMNKKGIRLEEIVEGRLSRKRPDGIAFKMTTEIKSGEFYETGV
jgi:hypothetical protein